MQKIAVVAGSMVDFGTWWQSVYEVPDGLILKVFGQRTMRASSYGARGGNLTQTGALLIKTRADAALRSIQCQTTGNTRATFSDVRIEGRFDVLSLRDAVQQGVIINMSYAKQFVAHQDIAALFRETLMDAEIAAPAQAATVTVRNDEGNEVQITTRKRRRAINFD
jgi:hypothetical protein